MNKNLASIKIDRQLVKALHEHKKNTGVNIQFAIEAAVYKYLTERNYKIERR